MSEQIVIQDNFLNIKEYNEVYNLFTGTSLPWSYNYDVVRGYIDQSTDSLYNFQFIHSFYRGHRPTSEYFDSLLPILSKLNIKALIRVKANLTPKSDILYEHGMHTDIDIDCTTALYYVNSNDGYTKFQDGTKIESVRNRLVTFPSAMQHTGTTCTDSKLRVVINFNYF